MRPTIALKRSATKPAGRGDARRSGGAERAAAECAGKSPRPEPEALAPRALLTLLMDLTGQLSNLFISAQDVASRRLGSLSESHEVGRRARLSGCPHLQPYQVGLTVLVRPESGAGLTGRLLRGTLTA
jgi:hypothetical protein